MQLFIISLGSMYVNEIKAIKFSFNALETEKPTKQQFFGTEYLF